MTSDLRHEPQLRAKALAHIVSLTPAAARRHCEDDLRQKGAGLKVSKGRETAERANFLAANRVKRSVSIDMAKREGRALIRQLAATADVVVENFKTGDLARYGLDSAGNTGPPASALAKMQADSACSAASR